MVTEDRQRDGYVEALPIWQNVTLPWLRRFRRLGLLQLGRERATAATLTSRLGVRMPSLKASMTQLSGGTSKKPYSRAGSQAGFASFSTSQHTGVDIRSKREIYEIIRDLASNGAAVIVASSEFEELEALCDRVLLLRNGRLVGELRGEEVKKDALLHALLAG